MAIPDYQTVMLPLLQYAADGQVKRFRDAVAHVARHFSLTEEELREMLPSGTQKLLDNRVGWARTYLTKAGLLKSPKRGWFEITERGLTLLKTNPTRVDTSTLAQFDEFNAFKTLRRHKPARTTDDGDASHDAGAQSTDGGTPQEQLESAYQRLRDELAEEILTTVRSASPEFFERLVLDLLVKMGYGGSRREAARGTKSSGDEGIDGIINEDRLGLDTIYIQAKRWKDGNTVGRPEVQKFAGALQGQQASKGVFITASSFTKDACDFATRIAARVILIDGVQLANLMIDHGVGVTVESVYEVKRLDTDYFSED